jgi:hypothetical protein
MIEKVIAIRKIGESTVLEDLAYWKNRTPEERISAVEILRRQYYGSSERLQRVCRIIERI